MGSYTARVTRPNLDPRVGRRIASEFELLERRGTGLAGPTYRARQIPLDRRLVVELIEGPGYDDPIARGRFIDETDLLVLPLGPGLARYRRFGIEPPGDYLPGCLYMIRDDIDGQPLDAILRRRASLTRPRAIGVTQAVLAALVRLHARDLIHRALRPAAVVLAPGQPEAAPHVTLLDAGLAPLVEPPDGRHRVGDPAYFAPALITGAPITPAVDLYAAGALLYTLLTGAPPFIGPIADVLRAHLERPIHALPTGLDPDRQLTGIVRRAMGRGEPFTDAADMARALDTVAALPTARPHAAPRVLLPPLRAAVS